MLRKVLVVPPMVFHSEVVKEPRGRKYIKFNIFVIKYIWIVKLNLSRMSDGSRHTFCYNMNDLDLFSQGHQPPKYNRLCLLLFDSRALGPWASCLEWIMEL